MTEEYLKRNRENFINTVKRQNFEWLMIENGMIEEDKFRALPPAKIKLIKQKVKNRNYI